MYRQLGKNLLSSNSSSTCPDNMVTFSPLTAEIGSGVLAPTNFNWFRVLAALLLNFAALNRGCHLCLAGRPSHWALAHILVAIKRNTTQLHILVLFMPIFVPFFLGFTKCYGLFCILHFRTMTLSGTADKVPARKYQNDDERML